MEFKNVIKRNCKIVSQSYMYNRRLFCIQLLQCFLDSFFLTLNLLIPKLLIQRIIDKDVFAIFKLLGLIFLVNIVEGLLNLIVVPYINVQNEKMNIQIVDSFLKKSYSLKMEYFDNADSYNKYNIVFDHCCDIFHNSKKIFFQFITAVLQIFMIISVLSWIDVYVFIAIMVFVMINLIVTKKSKKLSYNYNKDIVEQNRQLNFIYRLFYIPQFIRDLKVNEFSGFVFEKKREFSDELVNKIYSNYTKISRVAFVSSLIKSIENVLVMGYFVYECIKGYIWIDDFFVAINGYGKIKGSMETILLTYAELFENDLYINDYLEFMNSKEVELTDGKYEFDYEEFKSLEFDSVCFKYPNQEDYSLYNVSFRVCKGDKVAIVGENGVGKTTIVKLLLRLYDVESGTIKINGVNIKEYNICSLRNNISVMFQDFSIYPFSVRDNICLGKKCDEPQIGSQLELFEFYENGNKYKKILNLPITNQLYDGGIELSGGECQKLALARLFLANKKIMIMDEPTSNLDTVIEKKVFKKILDSENETMFVITHNLKLAASMKRIICICDGAVVGDGNHNTMIEKNEYYKRLCINN